MEQKSGDMEAFSSQWQHWAIQSVKQMASEGKFKGRKVVTAMPVCDVFIDQVKLPKLSEDKVRESVVGKVAGNLPFDPATALVYYVCTSAGVENEYLVMASDRMKVDHHLAIYERAGLEVEAIATWPLAMVWSYANFFGRRKNDLESTVMLLEIGANFTKVVICKHSNLLFARLLNVGVLGLKDEHAIKQMIGELAACARYFETQKGGRVERMIFLTSQSTDKTLCNSVVQLARDLQVPAQIGDVLAAIAVNDPSTSDQGLERRGNTLNWSVAVGLGLFNNSK
jgi:hypothetical protein